MRLDFYLSHVTELARKAAKIAASKGRVTVNGEVVKKANYTVQEGDQICLDDTLLAWPSEGYYLLHKPAGYVCATQDPDHPTVLDLLPSHLGQELKIVGRLDKDTTGLLLLTTDGQWLHRITSPRNACNKRYRMMLADPISDEDLKQLEAGVMLNGESQPTLPAVAERISDCDIYLTIQEGKYHQVKRMLAAVGNKVEELHRDQIGPLSLDADIPAGEFRALTEDEVLYF
ncbi:MAG: pseudouridine synthase [Gammaproteobacteria bacterium]|uniref:Pseudouridine synthase n=1 Tax=Marinomonas polaris DSM 16579 TaxID=1122206 RepID=A0A1M4SNT0_9GAMM|nr:MULTISPECIES: pseudouridine synthase [Marinomonas]MBU1297126.1 pseudouridine synthase [Gammaproteobacteria bacterium]MBU2022302.1 pseudouridine synthase [Gammaproteobacteria bacterium]MBU2238092.1 pseudouridine synthase [Gammaproteobacteria bacterium]MBU2318412.1 pseudouridine synthase [Gammaproteobacteria bacterium]MBU2413561.1 pseudouridine synthase [Gammaproteobacteria bacterium]